MAIRSGKMIPGVYIEYAPVRSVIISPLPSTARSMAIVPITATVIRRVNIFSFFIISFAKMEDAFIRQVSVDERIADKRSAEYLYILEED